MLTLYLEIMKENKDKIHCGCVLNFEGGPKDLI